MLESEISKIMLDIEISGEITKIMLETEIIREITNDNQDYVRDRDN